MSVSFTPELGVGGQAEMGAPASRLLWVGGPRRVGVPGQMGQ